MPLKFGFKFITLFIAILSFYNAHSQYTEPLTFQHIQEGMSQSSATVLMEDSFGFIWIGTRNGLNRYDGKDFEIYNKSTDGKTGLNHEYIVALYEDGQNIIIGTNEGLNVYNRDLNIITPYPFKNEGETIKNIVFETIVKKDNTLWLGAESEGLYKYEIETGKIKHFPPPNNHLKLDNHRTNKVIQIELLGPDLILAVFTYDTLILNSELEIISTIPQKDEIISSIKLPENTFLMGSSSGSLFKLKVQDTSLIISKEKEVSPGFAILSLEKNLVGELWIGTENNGLYIYSSNLDFIRHIQYSVTRPSSLSGDSIWSLLCTRDGTMWIAPYKSGLSFYDKDFFKFQHVKPDPFNPKSLSHKLVNCFVEDRKGNLWIGTDGGGLDYWDRSLDTFDNYSLKNKTFNSNVVLSILMTDENELWAGTWTHGIAVFNTNTKKYSVLTAENSFLKSNIIIDLLKDKKGRIWILNYFAGVQVYNPTTNTHQDIPLKSDIDGSDVNALYKIFEDQQSNIWVGTLNSGLFKLTEKDNSWSSTHYHTQKTLSNRFVNSIIQDTENTIWVGTQGGLNKYIPETDSFQSITKLNGLKNDAVKGIIDDKNNHLWLSTEDGIIRYNTNTDETINYDVGDGLQSNEFIASSSITTSKGEYIFGGINGYNVFTANEVEKRKDALTLFISGLKIFNKPVLPNDDFGVLKKDISLVDSLTFNYDQSVINFDFKALTFRHPENVNYAFYLEGFEKDWNYVGNKPTATYTNLNPGNYTLKIKSTNSDGVWIDNEKKLFITITPPYWQTWWFITLLIAFVILLIYLAYHLKLRSIKKYQRKLELNVAQRTKELQHQKNKLIVAANELESKNEEIQRFAFAVSHDLKSPLGNIKGLASLIPTEMSIEDHPGVLEYLNLIDVSCTNMNELISDITEIARLGKIENKNELLKTNEILNVSSNLIKSKLNTQNIDLTITENLPDIFGDRNRIIQVFGNFLDNAIKYMGDQPNPKIRVEFENNGDTNSFLVHDNGSGMNEHALEKLFTPFERFHNNVQGTGLGLYMVKKIATSHGGTITAASAGEGKGSTFKLTLPKAKIAAQEAKTSMIF
ncbi:Signal transduction histidine kinase [Maribacter sedimenticola]|uniref:histidine kinase n=1 Tax=Maribacter sedimenticola TaxID=228956 RepID=A0ABY1SCH4_9FLAO|nr:sensor histidine kinase [Maribacter sedimenticola]SNR25797.1 Signal transduction histidine kinase [Maribacter sedimenticola]